MRCQNTIQQREARARQIRQERDRLYAAKWPRGKVPLEKPIRHGWHKYLKLRADIARRKDAAVFEEILEVCGCWVWGLNKDEADHEWERTARSRKRDWRRAGFTRISKCHINKLSIKAKKYFVAYEYYWSPWQGSVKRYYCHVPEYYFVPAYKKAYITHLQVVDSELESRLDELENALLSNDLFRYSWYAGNGWSSKWWRRKEARNGRRRARMFLHAYDEEEYDQRVTGVPEKIW